MATLLVDGDNLAMRALHAVPHGTMSAGGVNTGAAVIFMSMLSRVVRDHDVDRMLVAFDCHDPMHPLARKQVFPDYKAQRKEAPEGREETFGLIWDILKSLGITVVQVPEMEGDDIIASAWTWERERSPSEDILILSGDKDLLQMVDARTWVLRPTTASMEVWDEARFWEHYQFPPKYLVDYLAMVGDVSDNIPGVRGVGPKKAWKILHENHLLGVDESFEKTLDRMESTGAWSEQQAAQGHLSYVLVDLVSQPLIEPGMVVAQEFEMEPRVTPALHTLFETYSLDRLRQTVERGRLWQEPEDTGDLLAAFCEAEGIDLDAVED